MNGIYALLRSLLNRKTGYVVDITEYFK